MPTILRLDGLRVVIYPADHRPAHVHVIGTGGEAAFVLNCPHGPPELRESYGFRRSEVGRIKQVLAGEIPLCATNGGRSMAVTEREFAQAEKHMQALRRRGYAVAAHYDRRTSRIIVRLNTGLELAFPPGLAEGLAGALPEHLAEIEISPAGLGLHWPKLDADVYIPALLQGVFGSRRWMASQLGVLGGRVRSQAKAASSRTDGRKGDRLRKKVKVQAPIRNK